MIPTAKEFLKKDNGFDDADIESLVESLKTKNIMYISDIHVTMIEFAKMHVKAALEAADREVPLHCSEGVLNCYPLKKIK